MKKHPYRMAHEFERAVIWYMIYDHDFWSLIGKEVEAEAMGSPSRVLVAQAILAHCFATDRVPGAGSIVLQRIVDMRNSGRVSDEAVNAVSDELDLIDDLDPLPSREAVLEVLVPTIKTRRRMDVVSEASKFVSENAISVNSDMSQIINRFKEIEDIGQSKHGQGLYLNGDVFDKIRDVRNIERLPVGIDEVDASLHGGVLAGTINVVMGGSGSGKSMALAHITGNSLLRGMNVFVATLELSCVQWMCRIIANLTGIPIATIADGSAEAIAKGRLADINVGLCGVCYFSASATKSYDIINFVEDVEATSGKSIDVLVVDYADLLGHSKRREYEGMKEVYSELRESFSAARKRWVWTASQARRKDAGKVGANDGADSQHKLRLADTWLSINPDDDCGMVEWHISKNRNDPSGDRITVPTELSCARMSPVTVGSGSTDPGLDGLDGLDWAI